MILQSGRQASDNSNFIDKNYTYPSNMHDLFKFPSEQKVMNEQQVVMNHPRQAKAFS